jgi:hypothetical protein
MVRLTQECESAVKYLFPNVTEQAQVKQLLIYECGDNLPLLNSLSPSAYDRIRFAVLKASKGDITSFRKMIDRNKQDWRDTLVGAGFAEDLNAHWNWFSSLASQN